MTCNRATWTALTFPRNLAHEVEAGRRASHTLEFQFIYVLKGWAIFDYEGYGEHRLVAGSTVYQPPGISHKEIDHSEDFEVLEITLPADFETREVK